MLFVYQNSYSLSEWETECARFTLCVHAFMCVCVCVFACIRTEAEGSRSGASTLGTPRSVETCICAGSRGAGLLAWRASLITCQLQSIMPLPHPWQPGPLPFSLCSSSWQNKEVFLMHLFLFSSPQASGYISVVWLMDTWLGWSVLSVNKPCTYMVIIYNVTVWLACTLKRTHYKVLCEKSGKVYSHARKWLP